MVGTDTIFSRNAARNNCKIFLCFVNMTLKLIKAVKLSNIALEEIVQFVFFFVAPKRSENTSKY